MLDTVKTRNCKATNQNMYIGQLIIPAALRSSTEAGGVFKMKVKLLSWNIKAITKTIDKQVYVYWSVYDAETGLNCLIKLLAPIMTETSSEN